MQELLDLNRKVTNCSPKGHFFISAQTIHFGGVKTCSRPNIWLSPNNILSVELSRRHLFFINYVFWNDEREREREIFHPPWEWVELCGMRAIPNGEKEEGKSLRALVDFTYVQAGPFPVFRRAMELAQQLLPAVAPFDSAKKKRQAWNDQWFFYSVRTWFVFLRQTKNRCMGSTPTSRYPL